LDLALTVANALRDHLPDLAALAAAAPHHIGVDTGLASVRPKLCEHLPRQGIPPAFDRPEDLVAAWRWAARAGALGHVGQWWWELRLHPRYGTVEVRVCDVQATVAEAAALAAVVQSLVAWLAARATAGDLAPPTPRWKLEANRWSACRHGVHGTMADLRTGQPTPTADRLAALLTDLRPVAASLGCETHLAGAWAMLADPAPDRHRRIAAQAGVAGLCAWLADRFADPLPGTDAYASTRSERSGT
jgi:carboxylate-amine ligase